MTIKKRQHFVPRFYLKYFSNSENTETINLYSIKKDIFVSGAPIKTQAYSNYFYGKDGKIENYLSIIEDSCAKLISKILESKELPKYESEEHYLLLAFIMSLSSRTAYAAGSLDESFDKMYKIILRKSPKYKQYVNDLDTIKIGIKNPGAYSLSMAMSVIPVVLDLEFKLLINNSKILFLTSDNPVIRYNQFLMTKKTFGGISGLGVKGIQIMLPLNLKTYIIFYDQNTYKIGNKNQRILEINNFDDINNLNLLQFINSDKNIYFNNYVDKDYVKSLVDKGENLRRKSKMNVKEYVLNSQNYRKESIIHLYNEDLKVNLKFTFFTIIKKAKKYNLKNNIIPFRNNRVIKEYINIKNRDEILYRNREKNKLNL